MDSGVPSSGKESVRFFLYSTGEFHGCIVHGVTESDTTKQLSLHSLNASAFPSPSVKLPMCCCQQTKACTRNAMPLPPLSSQPLLAMSGSYWLLVFMPGLSRSQATSFWIKPAGRHASSLAIYIYVWRYRKVTIWGIHTLIQSILLNTYYVLSSVLSAGSQQWTKKENISYYIQWRGQALDQQVRYTVHKACDKSN